MATPLLFLRLREILRKTGTRSEQTRKIETTSYVRQSVSPDVSKSRIRLPERHTRLYASFGAISSQRFLVSLTSRAPPVFVSRRSRFVVRMDNDCVSLK